MMIKSLLLSCAAVTATGCSALTGGATYTYNRTSADVCTLQVDTARVLEGGVSVQLDDCDVTVDAGKTSAGSNSIADVVDLVDRLNKKQEVPSP